MKRLSLLNKIKVLCTAAFIVGIAGGIIISSFISQPAEMCRVEFVVSEGDTLWDIANTYTLPENDIRYTIYQIKEINNMDTSELHPGDVIVVPVYSK